MSLNVNGSTQQAGTGWFQNMKVQKSDRAGVKEMISGEFKRLSSKAGSRQTAFADTNKKLQGTDVPQKLNNIGAGLEGCL